MNAPPLELREQDGQLRLSGYAATTEQPYDVGAYTETIARGAFRRTLANPHLDVALLASHSGLPFARTKSGTLALNEDDIGLRVSAQLDATDPDVQSVAAKMRRGDLTEMSFAFRANQQTWNSDYTERVITEADIHRGDVSLVTYGANDNTSATLRAAAGVVDLSLESRRDRAERLGQRVLGHGSMSGRSVSCARCKDTREITITCPNCIGDRSASAATPIRIGPSAEERKARAIITQAQLERSRRMVAQHREAIQRELARRGG